MDSNKQTDSNNQTDTKADTSNQAATGGKAGDSAATGQRQRDALEESEKDATRKQPENYRDEANADKVVDIGADKTKDPIKEIDPPEGTGR